MTPLTPPQTPLSRNFQHIPPEYRPQYVYISSICGISYKYQEYFRRYSIDEGVRGQSGQLRGTSVRNYE